MKPNVQFVGAADHLPLVSSKHEACNVRPPFGLSSFISVPSLAVVAMLVATVVTWSTPALALDAESERGDWTGVWVIEGTFMDKQDGSVIEPPRRTRPTSANAASPLKGKYAEAQKAAALAAEKGIQIGDSTASCMPQGMPTFWGGPFAFEIMQTGKQINVLQEWNEQTRRIYLDGRKHPEDLDPTFNGHSIGHWEGNTLVVDSVGFREQVYVAMVNSGHSDQMHITERLRLIEPDILEITMVITDELAYVQPQTRTTRLKRRRDMEIQEYICAENNRNAPDESGATTVILPGAK